LRIFIDTNILLSAVLFPEGKVSKVLSYILETHTIIISSYTIKECNAVFKKKFIDKSKCLKEFLGKIEYEKFETPVEVDVNDYPSIRDRSDLPILASAILCDADILLTGDKDFSEIEVKKPLIFTPSQYFELMNKKDN
jgi:putative PIN family toxin of toxin-antitoxin system